jgi:hypothetical protein
MDERAGRRVFDLRRATDQDTFANGGGQEQVNQTSLSLSFMIAL